MGKYKNLLVNVGIFGLSAVATKLMAFILMPLYTLYLSTEEYGIMDMATIMVTTLVPVLTLLINEGMLRFTLDDKSIATFYITETMLVMLASCVLLAIILPVFDLPIFGGLGRYKIWFLLSYAALCFPSVMGTVARAMDQMKLIAYASILSALIMGVLAYVLIAGMNLGLMGYFYSYTIGNGSAILVYLIAGKQYRFIDFSIWRSNASLRKQLWRYSLPLAPNSLCNQIQTTVSRFIITCVLGISASGLYAAASKIPNLLNVLQQVFQQAWQLSTFQEFKSSGLKHFYDVIWRVYHALMSIGSALVIALSPFIAKVLMQRQFYSVWPLISILVLAFYLGAINNFLGTIYQAYMRTKPLLIATIAGTVSCLAFTAMFVHSWGILAAAFGALVSSLTIFVIRVIDIRRLMRVDMRPFPTAITMGLLAAQSVVTLSQCGHYLSLSLICLLSIAGVQCYELKPLINLMFGRRKYTA